MADLSAARPATTRHAFRRGLIFCLPFALVIGPFGALFGVLATEAGLSLIEVMGFSLAVFAGASQFTAVQLIKENAPVVVIILATIAVNLRLAMYSAALTPQLGMLAGWRRPFVAFFLTDQNFAAVITEHELSPVRTPAERLAFFAGATVPLAPVWWLASWLGAELGAHIPPEFALDFAIPITFIALLAPLLRTFPQIVAAVVATGLALLLNGLPYSTDLLVAAAAAMLTGALCEIMLERRQ